MENRNVGRFVHEGPDGQAGEEFLETEVEDGVLCYKQEYDFLTHPCSWVELGFDESVVPKARICATKGALFAERMYDMGGDSHALEWLLKTVNASYQLLRFEDVIGFKTLSTEEGLIYHTRGTGITLDNIGDNSPSPMVEAITKMVAESMRELHDCGVHYGETVPTNFKYALGDKIILNPHNCMCEMGTGVPPDVQAVQDLAVILHTHSYIRDKPAFIRQYNTKPGAFDENELVRRTLELSPHIPELISSGELPLADVWATVTPFRQNGAPSF